MTRDKEILIQVGDRIRAARKKAEISQEQLGHLSGLHRTYIGCVERGERNISTLNLLSITSVLGIDAGEIITGLKRPPRLKP
ncbi:hypothetical protein GCM10027580_26920 [Corynebacterium faecale]|uniref:helix-turn-helix domain-containing protein n=1 Tax=Corynebacterium faecale TaxID=1758466 RepID=UPI0025B48713|nr:helix-turn-helix transcriptional regulator [Corynebacterium faecale]